MTGILVPTLCSLAVSLCLTTTAIAAEAQHGVSKKRSHGAAAPAGGRPDAAPTTVSFKRDLIPLFRDSCTMCHQGDIPMGVLDLTPDAAYDNLVGIQSANAPMLRVTPGHPGRSYLYYKTSGQNARIKGGGFGMPWGQALSASQVDLLGRWIEQGAKNN